MTDSSPPNDFDDRTELVAGGSRSGAREGAPPAQADEDFGDGWGEEEATAVVGATDIGGFFGERFRVDARLGIGAMGRVLTAIDMKTGTTVALKVLHKDRAKDSAVVERFQREAAVLREIRHPAIVRLVAFGKSADGTWWLAMEHLVGKTLKDRLSHGGPFTPRGAWPVLASICDGVALAHAKGVLHRDLKPENVLLLESGLPPCKILDFGLSRYTAKPDRITATGTVLGTPRYMAPEMLAESEIVDERSDVFAVGAIAFEMLTGRSIYPAEDFGQLFGCILEGRTLSLRAIRPDASPELDRVLADAVARDLDRRIPSVDELADRFARAIGVSEDRAIFLPAETGVRVRTARGPVSVKDTTRDLPPVTAAPEPPTAQLVAPKAAAPAWAPAPQREHDRAHGAHFVPTPQAPPPSPFAVPPADTSPAPRGSGAPASFTRPEPALPASAPGRPTWVWVALFAAAALVTMLAAGSLAYVLRTYLSW